MNFFFFFLVCGSIGSFRLLVFLLNYCWGFKNLKNIYIYIYIYIYINLMFDFLKPVYYWLLMSLYACSNRFLMLHNRTRMVIPCFISFMLKTFFLSSKSNLMHFCTLVWRWYFGNFQTVSSNSYFWKKQKWVFLEKPCQPISIGITLLIQPFFTVGIAVYCIGFFFLFVSLHLVFFLGNSQFYEEDTLLWIRPCYNVWPLFLFV